MLISLLIIIIYLILTNSPSSDRILQIRVSFLIWAIPVLFLFHLTSSPQKPLHKNSETHFILICCYSLFLFFPYTYFLWFYYFLLHWLLAINFGFYFIHGILLWSTWFIHVDSFCDVFFHTFMYVWFPVSVLAFFFSSLCFFLVS